MRPYPVSTASRPAGRMPVQQLDSEVRRPGGPRDPAPPVCGVAGWELGARLGWDPRAQLRDADCGLIGTPYRDRQQPLGQVGLTPLRCRSSTTRRRNPLPRTSSRALRTVDPRRRPTRPLSTTALTAQTSKASSPPSRWTSYHPPPWPTRCSPYRSVVARSPSCVRSLVELAAPRLRCSQ